jgi:hypothetical protein
MERKARIKNQDSGDINRLITFPIFVVVLGILAFKIVQNKEHSLFSFCVVH